jgi:NADH-quinone oxidoreductase subunit F/NADP-reducing hydrogenase subunit HndC
MRLPSCIMFEGFGKMSDKKIKFFVCVDGKKCPKRGSEEVLEALQREIETQGLEDSASAKGCKCLKLCKKGPAVFVSGDKTSYGRVTKKDVGEIVTAHVKDDTTVKRLKVKRKK